MRKITARSTDNTHLLLLRILLIQQTLLVPHNGKLALIILQRRLHLFDHLLANRQFLCSIGSTTTTEKLEVQQHRNSNIGTHVSSLKYVKKYAVLNYNSPTIRCVTVIIHNQLLFDSIEFDKLSQTFNKRTMNHNVIQVRVVHNSSLAV